MTTTYVYDFAEGNKDLKDLLGGKGANLAEMTEPRPARAARVHHHHRGLPRLSAPPARRLPALREEIVRPAGQARGHMGRRLGDPADPLLVSVRSGAKFSMPGMMETVLNIGLTDVRARLAGLAAATAGQTSGSPGTPTAGSSRCSAGPSATCPAEAFEDALEQAKRGPAHAQRPRSRRGRPAGAGRGVQEDLLRAHRRGTSRRTRASSWTWPSARSSSPGTPSAPCSTAARSASRPTSARPSTWSRWSSATSARTPAPASPSPATRAPGPRGVYGDYLANAQGEDVVAGIRNTVPLQDLERAGPDAASTS